jgi:hypothetical protein
MSKNRNSKKAANCPPKPAGIQIHITNQNATTSSHTMAEGSETPMFSAVTVHAHQPTKNEPINTPPICVGVKKRSNSK